jgi:hypothetical protein
MLQPGHSQSIGSTHDVTVFLAGSRNDSKKPEIAVRNLNASAAEIERATGVQPTSGSACRKPAA